LVDCFPVRFFLPRPPLLKIKVFLLLSITGIVAVELSIKIKIIIKIQQPVKIPIFTGVKKVGCEIVVGPGAGPCAAGAGAGAAGTGPGAGPGAGAAGAGG